MPTPIYSTDTAVLYRGDALRILPDLEPGSIDCVLTDPPYNSGGRTPTERRAQTARDKYVSGDANHLLADFAGDNRDQRGYTYWLGLVLSDCLHLTVPGSSLLMFTDWAQLPASADALQAAGWTWRGIIPWRKTIARPTKDGFKRECEYVLWGSNGQPHRHVPTLYLPGFVEGAQPRGSNRKHITQKPANILQQLLRVCRPGGTVLDPFAGSGSTGAAALAGGYRFVGVEYADHYADVAATALAKAAG